MNDTTRDRPPCGPGLPDPSLVAAIRSQYRLDWHGIHGVRHWARVLHNGRLLMGATGARADVVTLFALFHDACRHDDGHDPRHGIRGAELARTMHGLRFRLDAEGLALLLEACRTHTHGIDHPDPTVRTCWDADRLDLARVGIIPDPRRLTTERAREPDLIREATARARNDAFPGAEWFHPNSEPGAGSPR